MSKTTMILKSLVLLLLSVVVFITIYVGRGKFSLADNSDILKNDGSVYELVSTDDWLILKSSEVFVGRIKKEAPFAKLLYRSGLYAFKADNKQRVLLRYYPDDREEDYYFKKDEIPLIFSDTCHHLLFIAALDSSKEYISEAIAQKKGISDSLVISRLFAEIKESKVSLSEDLTTLFTESIEGLKPQYYGHVLLFYDEDPDYARILSVNKYTEELFTIKISLEEYLLSSLWLEVLNLK